jgi:acyl carrier protein
VHQSELDDAVRHVVAERLHVAPERLTLDSDLDDLGLDDAAAVSVLTGVEDVLEVRFPDDFFDGLRTYGDLTAAVRVAVGS